MMLPHEQLSRNFVESFFDNEEYLKAEIKLMIAYQDYDVNSTKENANKILNCLTNVEVVKAKIRYGIVHSEDLSDASVFIGQVRHT